MSAPITLQGRLGADPELRFTTAGKAVCGLRVATSRRVKNQAGEWEDADLSWWSVSCFEGAVNIVETLRKGSRVVIVGRIRERQYTKDDETRRGFEVIADHVAADLRWQAFHPVDSDGAPQTSQAPQASRDDAPPF